MNLILFLTQYFKLMTQLLQKFLTIQTLVLFVGSGLLITSVNAQNCDGGMVQTESGRDTVEICVDNKPDTIAFDSMNVSGANFRYIITDIRDTILTVNTSDSQDFNNLATKECHVYGFAYEGSLQNAKPGTHVSKVSGSTCDSLSRNFVTVFRNRTDGGMVQTKNGKHTVRICQDNQPDVIHFDSMNVKGANYRYIITGMQDTILSVKENDRQDFNNFSIGEVRVYGFAYKGALQNANTGVHLSRLSGSICDSLSRDFITVNIDPINGGMVQTESGKDSVEICKDAVQDFVHFDSMNVTGSHFRYIITDTNNQIQLIKKRDRQDFNNAPPGVSRIYGLAYEGTLQNTFPGNHVSEVSGSICESLSSNYITVIRNETNGGKVQTHSGLEMIEVCKNDRPSVVNFDSIKVSGANYRYIITDAYDSVVKVIDSDKQDFNDWPEGESRVYGLAYKGDLQNAKEGTPVEKVSATVCDSLSRGYLTVIRNKVDSAKVLTDSGKETVDYCLGVSDKVTFDSLYMEGPNFRYLITDASDTIVNPNAPHKADFDSAAPGKYHVWGATYSSNLKARRGMAIKDINTNICDSLSQNYITIHTDTVDGGTVSTNKGKDTVEVLIDNLADQIEFSTTSVTSPENYRYIITDASDTIVNPNPGSSQNFNPYDQGKLHVYGVAYQGTLNDQRGMHFPDITASECMEISENHLVINRVDKIGFIGEGFTRKNDLKIYPNPADQAIQVSLTTEKPGPVALEIRDISGKILLKEKKVVHKGHNSLNIKLNKAWKGTYMLSIRQGGDVYRSRLILQ